MRVHLSLTAIASPTYSMKTKITILSLLYIKQGFVFLWFNPGMSNIILEDIKHHWLHSCTILYSIFGNMITLVYILEFTVSCYLSELNWLHPEYYFLRNNEPISKFHLDIYFKDIIVQSGSQPHYIWIIRLKLNTGYLVLESLLDSITQPHKINQPKSRNKTLIPPGYSLINIHLCQIAPTFNNHFLIFLTLSFITQASKL